MPAAAAVHRARTAADVASAALRKRVDAEHGQHRAERERAEGLQAQLRAQRSAAEAATAAAGVDKASLYAFETDGIEAASVSRGQAHGRKVCVNNTGGARNKSP